MAIEPDTKDWTWVLDRPCPECGIDVSTMDVVTCAVVTRRVADRFADRLTTAPDPAGRPAAQRWSALEYGCHVRDVFRLFRDRLVLMLDQDDPRFPNWDQDATAVDADYPDQDPTRVAVELRASGHAMADALAAVAADQLERPGRRSNGSTFTVLTLARYFVHDPLHHLYDIGVDPQPVVDAPAGGV